MRTYSLIALLGLLPLVAMGQTPTVIARNCALNSSEAIFDSGRQCSEEGIGGPQARSKIASPAEGRARDDVHASPDARASHPPRDDGGEMTAATLAVLRANCPKGMNEAEWLKLMEIPANRTLFPLRVTQGMLDTLDAKKLDLGYSYVLVNNSSQMH